MTVKEAKKIISGAEVVVTKGKTEEVIEAIRLLVAKCPDEKEPIMQNKKKVAK